MAPFRLASGFLQMLPMQIYKDEGMLPYYLARELGWECDLVYWMKEDLDLIEPADYARWVRRIPVSISPSRARHTLLFQRYLIQNAKNIDALMLYHLTSESLMNAFIYKALNPRGVAVLKLDMDHRGLAAFDGSPLLSKRGALMRLFAAAPLDFLTIETENMYERLIGHVSAMGHRLHVLPIGINCSSPIDIDAVLADKENIVLTAGRLGVEQKNNQMLLEAIARLPVDVVGDWQFWFVGTLTPDFEKQISDLRSRRPDLAQRVIVRDFVASREELEALYKRTRVYCLSSRWESFAIVLGEAAYCGCYLVSTEVGVAPELTERGTSGELVPSEDPAELALVLARILSGSVPTDEAARRTHARVKQNFDWPVVARRFADLVLEYKKDPRPVERSR